VVTDRLLPAIVITDELLLPQEIVVMVAEIDLSQHFTTLCCEYAQPHALKHEC
jgi:hypothetical protein